MINETLEQLTQSMRELAHIENIKGRIKERETILNIIDTSMKYADYDAAKTLSIIIRYMRDEGRDEILKEMERLQK